MSTGRGNLNVVERHPALKRRWLGILRAGSPEASVVGIGLAAQTLMKYGLSPEDVGAMSNRELMRLRNLGRSSLGLIRAGLARSEEHVGRWGQGDARIAELGGIIAEMRGLCRRADALMESLEISEIPPLMEERDVLELPE